MPALEEIAKNLAGLPDNMPTNHIAMEEKYYRETSQPQPNIQAQPPPRPILPSGDAGGDNAGGGDDRSIDPLASHQSHHHQHKYDNAKADAF